MKNNTREFIYLNCLKYSGTVYHTQILDWLHLFDKHNVKFKLIQLFQLKEIAKPNKIKAQLSGIKRSTKLFAGYVFLFPSRSFFALLNAVIIFFKLKHVLLRNKEVLIFSRALIGPEIKYLRKITRCKLIFIFDARAATAEEKRYSALKQNDYTPKKANRIADIFNLEKRTISEADKVFSVSKVLSDYFVGAMNVDNSKFIRYPCLSDSEKFYYNPSIRNKMREDLNLPVDTRIYIYAGGLTATWHMAPYIFRFFNELLRYDQNFKLLLLTKDQNVVEKAAIEFPSLQEKLITTCVPNIEVYSYLNAADYGILFRENTIMNNVASPTKFAEYMLCGLPAIISEGVGDYSTFTKENDIGVVLSDSDLKAPEAYDFRMLLRKRYDRNKIAAIGLQYFAKKSLVENITTEFES